MVLLGPPRTHAPLTLNQTMDNGSFGIELSSRSAGCDPRAWDVPVTWFLSGLGDVDVLSANTTLLGSDAPRADTGVTQIDGGLLVSVRTSEPVRFNLSGEATLSVVNATEFWNGHVVAITIAGHRTTDLFKWSKGSTTERTCSSPGSSSRVRCRARPACCWSLAWWCSFSASQDYGRGALHGCEGHRRGVKSTERRDGMEDRIDPWSSSTSTDYEAIITRFGLDHAPRAIEEPPSVASPGHHLRTTGSGPHPRSPTTG